MQCTVLKKQQQKNNKTKNNNNILTRIKEPDLSPESVAVRVVHLYYAGAVHVQYVRRFQPVEDARILLPHLIVCQDFLEGPLLVEFTSAKKLQQEHRIGVRT